jgi:hypothetical protein
MEAAIEVRFEGLFNRILHLIPSGGIGVFSILEAAPGGA